MNVYQFCAVTYDDLTLFSLAVKEQLNIVVIH